MSVNAAKWAGVAKDSVFKFSKTAAEKATELSSKVGEQAKDGTLLTNVQSGVTTMASSVSKLSTKTWSDMQSFWTGKDEHSANANDARLRNDADTVSATMFRGSHSGSPSAEQLGHGVPTATTRILRYELCLSE